MGGELREIAYLPYIENHALLRIVYVYYATISIMLGTVQPGVRKESLLFFEIFRYAFVHTFLFHSKEESLIPNFGVFYSFKFELEKYNLIS